MRLPVGEWTDGVFWHLVGKVSCLLVIASLKINALQHLTGGFIEQVTNREIAMLMTATEKKILLSKSSFFYHQRTIF